MPNQILFQHPSGPCHRSCHRSWYNMAGTRVQQCSTNIRFYRSYLFTLVGMLVLIWFVYQHTSCFHEKLDDVTLLPVNLDARFTSRLCIWPRTSRRRTFTTLRIPYNVAGTSSFQLYLKSRDIHPNPGQQRHRGNTPKHPCGEK